MDTLPIGPAKTPEIKPLLNTPEVLSGEKTIPQESPKTPQTSSLRSIRTYKTDVAENVRGGKSSLVSMVMAEQRRKQVTSFEGSSRNPKNIIFISLGILFVVLGGVLFFFFTQKSAPPGEEIVVQKAPTLFFTEAVEEISVTGLTSAEFSKKISAGMKNASVRLDAMKQIYFSETIQGSKTFLGSKRFFFFLDNRVPQVLLRSLNDPFMLGVHVFNGNNPFLVLTTNLYENSFTGMLSWERSLARDVLPVFGNPLLTGDPLLEKPFRDEIVRNLDARVLRNDQGKIILLYIFKDRETIIIATNEDTLEEVIRRLNTSQKTSR